MKLKRAFNLFSVFVLSSIAVPVVLLLLGGIGFPHDTFFLSAAAVISVLLGYILQHLSAFILGQKVSMDSYGDDGGMQQFRVTYAFIPLSIFIIATIPIYVEMKALLDYWMANGIISYLNSSALYAFVGAVVFLLCSVSGVVIWFYPAEKLATPWTGIAGFAVLMIEFIFGTFFYPLASAQVAVCISAAVFAIYLMLIYNQTNMQLSYRGTVVEKVSRAARVYNLLLVIFLLICILLIFAILYILFRSLYIIGSFLVFIVLYSLLNMPVNGGHNGEYYESSGGTVGVFSSQVMKDGGESVLTIFFALIFLAVFCFVLAKTGILWNIIESIKNAIRDFFSTIKLGREIFYGTDLEEYQNDINYKDEKTKLQDALIREYMDMAESTDKYSLFIQRLSSLHDYNEQLSFAYAMLVTVLRKENGRLRLSDTPREVQEKVKYLVEEDSISHITQQFEFVKYGEIDLTTEEASHVLGLMCDVIKRYIF